MYVYGPFRTCMFVEKLLHAAVKDRHFENSSSTHAYDLYLYLNMIYFILLAAESFENHLSLLLKCNIMQFSKS